jgi:hypothetical protein
MTVSDLAYLACGDYSQRFSIVKIFDNLSQTITNLENNIHSLPLLDNNIVSILGPYYGRSLLETICIVFIGRIDPFKLMVLENIQKNYTQEDLNTRSSTSINWAGDIFEDFKQKRPTKDSMWSSTIKYESVSRALFDMYYETLFWVPAYTKLLDTTESIALNFYKSNISPEAFMLYIRQRISGLYSNLSKGVHNELIIDSQIFYDRETVIERLKEVLDICSILAVTCHNIDCVSGHHELPKAVEIFERLYERREKYGE